MRSLVSVNGRLSSPEEAVVPALDRGFLFGDSVYEVLWWHRGALVQAKEHFDRLRESGRRIYLDVEADDTSLASKIEDLVTAAGARDEEAYVRLVVSRGAGPLGLAVTRGLSPAWVIVVADAHRPSADERAKGISACIAKRLRVSPRALDPGAKTGNYMNNLLALHEARRAGVDDAILLNDAGDVTEATTSNVYVVTMGRLVTPPIDAGILRGTTRSRVLSLARANGLDSSERRVSSGDLARADEIFVSSSVRGVLPVVKLDGEPVGSGSMGAVTSRVIDWFESAADAEVLAVREARAGASTGSRR